MFTLTAQAAARAALDYHSKGVLAAQHGTAGKLVELDGCRCAIGAALPDDLAALAQIRGCGWFGRLVYEHLMEAPDEDEVDALMALANAHDGWCDSSFVHHHVSRGSLDSGAIAMLFPELIGRVMDEELFLYVARKLAE